MHRSARRRAALTSALVLLACSVGTAHAGQIVYDTEPQNGDSQIRVMNDDGTNDRLLVHEDDIPGAEAVQSPYVSPDGTTVVFTARTPGPSGGGLYCGFRCVGIYAYRGGEITRISQEAIDCVSGDDCFGYDSRPRITGDGQGLFYELVYGVRTSEGTPDVLRERYFRTTTPGGGSEAELPDTPCGEGTNVTPNPAANGEYATSVYCGSGVYALKIMRTTGAEVQEIGRDDDEFAVPAFRGDGRLLVGAEGQGDPGIWIYDRQGPAFRRAVAVGWSGENAPFESSPTFVGIDRIAFLRDDTVRLASAACDSCTLGETVALGQRPGVSTIAWTSQGIASPTRGGDGGGGTPDPGPGPAPGGGPAAPTPGTTRGGGGPSGGAAGTTAALRAPARVKLAAALRGGLRVPFTAPRSGRLTLRATISGSLARRLRLVKRRTAKPVVVAQGSAAATAAGTGSVTLRFTSAARKRLRTARAVPLTLTGTFGGSAVAGRVRLTR